jgi:hypothetical protein
MDWKFGKSSHTEGKAEISWNAVTWNIPTWAEM